MTPEVIEQLARRFALLGDPTRLRILHVLIERGELSVGTVAAAASTSRYNASAHLNRLFEAGLVARRRQATAVYYRTLDESLPRVCQLMCESLRSQARLITDDDALVSVPSAG